MQRNHSRPSPRRALAGSAAFLVLFLAGAGAALADRSCRGDHRHGGYRGDRYDHHRDYRERRGHHRDERYRYERYDRRGRRYGDHRDTRYDRHGSYPRYFEIPRSIHRQHLDAYRGYYHGRVYHPAHRHDHEVYRFPVYGAYGVEYHPYAYCEGSFFARGVFRHGRALFDLRIGF